MKPLPVATGATNVIPFRSKRLPPQSPTPPAPDALAQKRAERVFRVHPKIKVTQTMKRAAREIRFIMNRSLGSYGAAVTVWRLHPRLTEAQMQTARALAERMPRRPKRVKREGHLFRGAVRGRP